MMFLYSVFRGGAEFNYLFTFSFNVAYKYTDSTGQLRPRGLNLEEFNYRLRGYFTDEKVAQNLRSHYRDIFLSTLAFYELIPTRTSYI